MCSMIVTAQHPHFLRTHTRGIVRASVVTLEGYPVFPSWRGASPPRHQHKHMPRHKHKHRYRHIYKHKHGHRHKHRHEKKDRHRHM